MSDVTALLDKLAAGDVELDAVVEDFRTRDWPEADEPGPDSGPDAPYAAMMTDPDVPIEGSFFDVAAAYTAGKITDEQYAALYAAAAEAQSADPDVDDDQVDLFGENADGKAFPWEKGGKDKDKPSISAGAFVSGNFGKGKVEVVVTSGKVPGVDTEVEGTKSEPAARVQVYEETDGKWKASGKKVAVKLSSCKTIPPLGGGKFGKKSGDAELVLLAATLDPAGRVPAATLATVYERGVRSWPGESKTILTAAEWGAGRAQAFVDREVRGVETPGYVGDVDLRLSE